MLRLLIVAAAVALLLRSGVELGVLADGGRAGLRPHLVDQGQHLGPPVTLCGARASMQEQCFHEL